MFVGARGSFSCKTYETSVDPCIQCTKRSVFERSVFECGVSNIFFDLFFDDPLDAVASERACSSIFDFWGLRSDHFRAFFDFWGLRSDHFRAFFDVRRLRSEHFRVFSTSGGFGASIFEHSRRLEASERAFSRFLEASSEPFARKPAGAPENHYANIV